MQFLTFLDSVNVDALQHWKVKITTVNFLRTREPKGPKCPAFGTNESEDQEMLVMLSRKRELWIGIQSACWERKAFRKALWIFFFESFLFDDKSTHALSGAAHGYHLWHMLVILANQLSCSGKTKEQDDNNKRWHWTLLITDANLVLL